MMAGLEIACDSILIVIHTAFNKITQDSNDGAIKENHTNEKGYSRSNTKPFAIANNRLSCCIIPAQIDLIKEVLIYQQIER